MRSEPLHDAFRQVTESSDKFTRRMAITLADMFDTGPMVLVARLEREGLLRAGSFDWFKVNGGITRKHVEKVRGETRHALGRRRCRLG